MGMSSVIGALRVVLGMDTAQFEAGADKGRQAANGLHSALGGFSSKFAAMASGAAIGTAAVTAFSAGMKMAAEAAQYADDIAAQAYKLGVSAEYLQEFSHAAEASDVPAEAAKDALLALTAAIGALQTKVGDGKIRKAMEALGIPQEQIESFRTAQDALPVLADKISQLGTVTEQLQFAKKFGIEALLPLLKQGSGGIKGLMDSASQLGVVLDEDVVNRLADMNEQMRVADERAKIAGLSLGGALTPALVTLKGVLADTMNQMAQFLDQFNKIEARATSSLETRRDDAYGQMSNLLQKGVRRKDGSFAFGFERDEYARQQKIYNDTQAELERRRAKASSAATPGPLAADYSGGDTKADKPKKATAAEIAAARAKAEGRVAGPSAEEMWGTADWVSQLDNKTVAVEDVLPLKEIKPAFKGAISEGALEGQLDAMARAKQQVQDGYRYAIEGGLYAAIRGGGKGLMQYLADQFQRSFVEGLASGLSKTLANAGGSGGGGWGSLFKTVSTAFSVGQNANGTTNWRGGLTLVGERGAELINLPRGSQITPNHALSGLGAGQPIALTVTPSQYFDVAVQSVAAPIAVKAGVAASEVGAAKAGANQARASRYRMA